MTLKINHIAIDRLGIEFSYYGDSVIWVWPWARSSFNARFISISFMVAYKSLKDIDLEWAGYREALKTLSTAEENL